MIYLTPCLGDVIYGQLNGTAFLVDIYEICTQENHLEALFEVYFHSGFLLLRSKYTDFKSSISKGLSILLIQAAPRRSASKTPSVAKQSLRLPQPYRTLRHT